MDKVKTVNNEMDKVKPVNNDKLWTKYYVVIMVINLFTSTTNMMFSAVLPLYVLHIGGSSSATGLVLTFFAISALLFRPASGRMTDTRSRQMVLLGGTAVSILALLFYHAAYTTVILLVIRCLHGLGFSAQSTASGTIVADIVPPARLSEGIGYFGISFTIATAVGPGIGLFLVKSYGYGMIFNVALIMGVISLVCIFFLDYEKRGFGNNTQLSNSKEETMKTEGSTPEVQQKKLQKGAFLEKSALEPSLITFFLSIGTASIITFIPAFGVSRGLEDIGLFFTVYACALLVTRIVSGKLADRYGVSVVLQPSFVVLVISFIMIAYAYSISIVLVAAVLFGVGSGTSQPILNAITIKRSPIDRRGAANATLFSAFDIGLALGAAIWGVVSQFAGFTYVFIGSAVFTIVAAGVFFLVLRDKE